jgi:sugar/nucleoside kinase (ribokinase family)
MSAPLDIVAIGNAIVDVIAPAEPAFLEAEGLTPGSMTLVDGLRAEALYERMAAGIEASGGSAANTVAGAASLGASAAFMGKVADDPLGRIFAHDIRAIGAHFETPPLADGPSTARCLVNVTPDGQRTMCTYLGACVEFGPDDVDPATIAAARILYLEGYLFDPPAAREAFAKAAAIAQACGCRIALSLSDSFVVERHREALLGFIETHVNILLANEAEVCALVQANDVGAAMMELRGRVGLMAVTQGAEGSAIATPVSVTRIGAHAVAQVLDTTGAGDQYAAGFLVGVAQGRVLAECGALGSMAAAEVISHYGPRPAISLVERARSLGLLAA